MPDLIGLAVMERLTIQLSTVTSFSLCRFGKLGTLKQPTLERLNELQEMPDLIGLTALGSLKFECGSKLQSLPGGLGELPCIETLTTLHELCLHVADYAQGSCTFTALSRSLPCLQLLQVLRLRASDVHQTRALHVALQARDVLAIGHALKAWPLPLLHAEVVDVYDDGVLDPEEHADAEENLRLSTC